jgi:hypothetical protein
VDRFESQTMSAPNTSLTGVVSPGVLGPEAAQLPSAALPAGLLAGLGVLLCLIGAGFVGRRRLLDDIAGEHGR